MSAGPLEIQPELEAITDRSNLRSVLYALSQMCYEKADHLRSNWQDSESARAWDTYGRRLDRLAFHATEDSI